MKERKSPKQITEAHWPIEIIKLARGDEG